MKKPEFIGSGDTTPRRTYRVQVTDNGSQDEICFCLDEPVVSLAQDILRKSIAKNRPSAGIDGWLYSDIRSCAHCRNVVCYGCNKDSL
jgi:hypothetical protein